MAIKLSFIVSHNVEQELGSEYHREELENLLGTFYKDVEVFVHYVLPDEDEVEKWRQAND